jgi:hypothetical protein
MFLLVLGGSLVLGAGLLAAASLSDGTLVSLSTAAQSIGWLFVVATVVGVASLRRGDFRQLGAATVTFLSALTVLYVSYFESGEVPSAPISYAVAEPLPAVPVVYKVIESEPLAAVLPVATKEIPVVAKVATPEPTRDRCDAETGLAWLVCREKARLKYCEGREGDEATCPSAIPFSPPG